MKRWMSISAMSFLVLILVIAYGMRIETEPADTVREHTVRISLWDYDLTEYDRELVRAFEEANPDIHIEVMSYRSEVYPYYVQSLLESGSQVDVVYANQMAMFTELSESGFCEPLDSYIKRDNISVSPYSDYFHSSEGKIKALPYRIDKFLLYYNKDLFDRAGMPYPTSDMTWEEWQTTADTLQQTLNPNQHSAFSIYIPTHWSEIFTSASFSIATMDLDELRRGIHMLIQMQEKGTMVSMQEMNTHSGAQRLFETGNYGMYVCGTWLMHYFKIDAQAGACQMNWGVTERPHWEGKENENAAWVTSLCINKNSKEKEAAWKFVNFVCGKQGAEIMANNLMIPAYQDADITRILEQQMEDHQLTISLDADSFDAPKEVSSLQESRARAAVISEIGRCVLGLQSEQACISKITKIQADFLEDLRVE